MLMKRFYKPNYSPQQIIGNLLQILYSK